MLDALSNGTMELNITQADDENWTFTDIGDADSDYIVYRDNANWERVCDNAAPPDNWDTSTLEPWNKGYWICVLRGG